MMGIAKKYSIHTWYITYALTTCEIIKYITKKQKPKSSSKTTSEQQPLSTRRHLIPHDRFRRKCPYSY